MTSRRKFIKATSVTAAGTLIAPIATGYANQLIGQFWDEETGLLSKKKDKKMGVQSYSVRHALNKDFAGSMKKLADMGYTYIEGYGLTPEGQMAGAAPKEYKKIVGELGMNLLSTHSSLFYPEQASKIIEIAHDIGLKYLVVSGVPEKLRDDYYKVSEILNKTGEKFKGSGVKMCYHNHAFEFDKINGEVPLEIMLKETDPELLSFEADLYWVTKGKANPMDLINKFPGRFSLFHIKDANVNLDMTTVGEGIIDFPTIMKHRKKAGLEHYFIEDERENDPFGNLEKAFNYMNNLKD